MSLSRYALRTAGFAALYLVATFAGLATAGSGAGVRVLWPAAAAGALWLVAQARAGRRNLDVIALAVLAVLLPLGGSGILSDFTQAVPQVVPALIFAWLFDRWLPGYWLGHGDRFRRAGPSLLRLAAAATLAALSGAVLQKILDDGLAYGELGYLILRDGTAVLLAVLAARGLRHLTRRRRDEPATPAETLPETGGPGETTSTGRPGRPSLTIVK